MARTDTTSLLVVERESPRRIVGEVTLRDMLKARVRHLEEETRRERPIPIHLVVPRWLRSTRQAPPSP